MLSLSSARKLIPSPAVLLALAIVGAVFALYIRAVGEQTSQLNQRNFYHLSTTEHNLRATLAAVSKMPRMSKIFTFGEVEECSGQDCEKQVANDYREAMSDRLITMNELFTSKDQINVVPTRKWNCRDETTDDQVRFDTKGIRIDWHEDLQFSDGASFCLNVSLSVPYANIRGIRDHPYYFRSVLIFNANTGKVFLDTNQLPVNAGRGASERALNLPSRAPEHLSSMAVVEYLYKRQVTDIYATRNSEEKPDPYEGDSFAHSEIVPFEMGDNAYLLFIQPTELKIGDDPMVIVGLVKESEYRMNRYSIDLLTFTYISLTLIGLIALTPILRLYLIDREAIIRPRDWIQLSISIPLVATIVLILCNTVLAHKTFFDHFDRQLYDLVQQIEKEFEAEVKMKFNSLDHMASNHPGTLDNKFGIRTCVLPDGKLRKESQCDALCLVHKPVASDVESGSSSEDSNHDSMDQIFSTVFNVDYTGKRSGDCYTALRSPSVRPGGDPSALDQTPDWTRTDLSHREYVQRILTASGFYDFGYKKTKTKSRGYMERIESISDGVFETAFSVSGKTDSDKEARVVVGLSTLQVFEKALMPFGFNFVLFDQQSGGRYFS